jgi:hypothetical protein
VKILLLLVVFVSNYAYAGTSGFVSITDKKVQIIGGDEPRVFLYDVVINDSECSNTTPVLLMEETQVLAKELFSVILTAKSVDKMINVVTDGCWNYNQYPIIKSIYIK